jgi:chaperonin GroES
MGRVRGIGPGATSDEGKKIPMAVKVGQKVMYKKWGGNEIKVEGKEWLLVEQKDILAIVE